jgi:hypothetical protein
MDDDSSIDGSLEDFLQREGIKGFEAPGASALPYTRGEDVSFSSRSSVLSDADVNTSFQSNYSAGGGFDALDLVELLLPATARVSKVLQDIGHSPVHITKHDIDSSKKMSVYVIDAWAQSVLSCLTEMKERVEKHSSAVKSASLSQRKNEVSNDVLESRVKDLQEKLLDAERKLKASDMKVAQLSEQTSGSASKAKSSSTESKRIIRNLEEKVRESERRVRQRDIEADRLKEKLRTIMQKEKDTAKRHSDTLKGMGGGGAAADTSFTSTSSIGSKSSGSVTSMSRSRDVLEALESQRDALERRNTELDSQVIELSSALKEALNNKGDSIKPVQKARVDATQDDDGSEDMDALERTATAQAMYDKIKEQSRTIDKLAHRCKAFEAKEQEAAALQTQMKIRNDELRESLENLRLEMETRPTPRAWAEKQKELREVEDKLHDLTMMRGEAAELAAWRKHMSVTDRIKVDKRNHELGLWVLDSLPKAVTKEVLQTVCRELDVSDVSEVQPCLAKLKAVVKAVPRMEKFISQVCEYLFERDRKIQELNGGGFNGRARPSMEDVLPVLQRWWSEVQQLDALGSFQDKVLGELHRREQILSKQPLSDDGMFGPGLRFKWSENEIAKALDIIHGLVDFEAEVVKHKKSFGVAEDFLRDQPELLINRQISHIQYLFNISSVEGIYPRMNQVYLFHEQMSNFLNTTRMALDMKNAPDANVVAELQRIMMDVAGKAEE